MGCGNSMMLVTSLAMVAEIIGDDKVSVWSAFSFHPELPVCTHGTTPFRNSLRFRNVDNLPQEFPLVILLCFLHREGSQEIALTVLRIKTLYHHVFLSVPVKLSTIFHPSSILSRISVKPLKANLVNFPLDIWMFHPIISTTFTTLLHEILQFRPHPPSSSASLLYKNGWTSYGRFSEGEGGGVGEGGEWNIHKPSEGKGM